MKSLMLLLKEHLPANHPIWRILGNLTLLFIILALMSSNFDSTEIKTLILAAVGSSGIELLSRKA